MHTLIYSNLLSIELNLRVSDVQQMKMSFTRFINIVMNNVYIRTSTPREEVEFCCQNVEEKVERVVPT